MKKVILVTGASRGIGNNIARSLARENIVIANYNKSKEKAGTKRTTKTSTRKKTSQEIREEMLKKLENSKLK